MSILDRTGPTWSAIKQIAEALRERLQGQDDEIEAIKKQMTVTQKQIEDLQIEMRMLRCQLDAAQRLSLAQKLRQKGVTK